MRGLLSVFRSKTPRLSCFSRKMCTESPPGVSYRLGSTLYLSLTNECNAEPLVQLRGPGFEMPSESGFAKLPKGGEPDATVLASVIESHYQTLDHTDIGGMGESDTGVVFAGYGEPLLRLPVLAETISLVKERRHGVPFRVVTNGLFDATDAEALSKAGVHAVTVSLLASDPVTYAKIAKPMFIGSGGADLGTSLSGPKAFSTVCGFISTLAESGTSVECTAIEAPGVSVPGVKKLALALGAVSFRSRSFHP